MKNIENLNLGFADAENYLQRGYKELFNRIFIKNRFLDKILLPSTYFIIGEKGTGKTAYAVYLANNDYKNTNSTLKFIRETDYQKFIKLKTKNQLDLSDYSNIWAVIILLLLAQNITEKELDTSIFFRNTKLKKLIDAIEAYYHNAFSPEIVNVLSFIENSEVAASMISKYAEIKGKSGTTNSYSESRFQINMIYILRQFKDAISSLKLAKNHTLYIDGIDIRPGVIPYPDYLECIKGLADAVWNINRDFFSNIRDSKGRLKVVLLLRADIFNSLSLQNLNNKLHDNSVYLDWRTTYADYMTSDLYKLSDRILRVQQDEVAKDDSNNVDFYWNAYLPWTTPSTNIALRQQDTSFINLLRISYSRPRDILSILQILKDIACERNQASLTTFLFEIFSSEKFKNDYSEYLMGGIKDQLSFYYNINEYEDFLKFFTFLNGSSRFSYNEYENVYSKFEKYILKSSKAVPKFAENKDVFLQFLYDNNILCYKDERESKLYFRWCYRERGPSNISPKVLLNATLYEIHYGLWKALNVGEK